MSILPRLKYWLKSLELFIVQIPILLSSYFVSGLFSVLFVKDATILLIVFLILFFLIASLLFGYYYDWGKEQPKHRIKFLPSKTGFIEGFFMALFAMISNFIASIPLSCNYGSSNYTYFNQVSSRCVHSNDEIINFIILWLWVASNLLQWQNLRNNLKS